MDQEKVLNIAKEYAAAVRKVVDATAIFLYESYTRGTATKDSGIELVLLTAADDESVFLSVVQKTALPFDP